MGIIHKFHNSISGSTATVFAVAMIPAAFVAGTAVDYSRYASARSQIQEATDAAALAAAKYDGTNTEKIANGTGFSMLTFKAMSQTSIQQ